MRVDHAALVRGHTEPGEICEVAGLGPIPVAAARELMADAFIAAVVTRGVDVTTVAHLGRRPTAYQETALEWQAPVCSVAGCPRTVAIEHDHRTPWAEAQTTATDNLDPLCHFHHELKTHRGYRLEPGTGRRRLLPCPTPSTDH